MNPNGITSRIKVALIFMTTWLLTSFLIALACLMVIQDFNVFKNKWFHDFLVIFLPSLAPAVLLGSLLAPKLLSLPFKKTTNYQILGSLVWSAMAATYLFIVMFKAEISMAFSGTISFKSLILMFLKGLPIFALGLNGAILPCTLAASFISSRLLRHENTPP